MIQNVLSVMHPQLSNCETIKNIRFFRCKACGDFFISRSAVNCLNNKESHRKAHFAQLSASYKGKKNILAITIVAGEGLHKEVVPRTNYPE